MDFSKIVHKVRHGRIAKISGSSAELKQARAAVCSIDPMITVQRSGSCLYVYSDPLEISFVDSSVLPR